MVISFSRGLGLIIKKKKETQPSPLGGSYMIHTEYASYFTPTFWEVLNRVYVVPLGPLGEVKTGLHHCIT